MKSKRELELEIELCVVRDSLIRAHLEILQRDGRSNQDQLEAARNELTAFTEAENADNQS